MYHLKMSNGSTAWLHVFLVYETACSVSTLVGPSKAHAVRQHEQYEWANVTRRACQKGCSGPMLLPMKISGPKATSARPFVRLAIDEGSSHVGKYRFR